jgi:hypothetical protein
MNDHGGQPQDRLAGIVRTVLRERYPAPQEVDLLGGLAAPRDRREHRARVLLAVAATVLVVVGVAVGYAVATHQRGPTDQHAGARIIGITWKASIGFGTAVFTQHTVSLDDGCDNALYRLTISPHHFRIGKAIGARSVCLPAPGGPPGEERFDQVMHGRVKWARAGDKLLITNRSGVSLAFHNSGPAPELEGQDWVLTRVIDEHGGDLSGSFDAAHLRIDHGQVRATDLCGTATGTASTTDTTITFHATHFTTQPASCTTSTKPIGNATIDVMLSGADTYRLSNHDMLFLWRGDRGLVYKISK